MDKHKHILFELLAYHYMSEGLEMLANDVKQTHHNPLIKQFIQLDIVRYLRE
jgi:hypothetical protein